MRKTYIVTTLDGQMLTRIEHDTFGEASEWCCREGPQGVDLHVHPVYHVRWWRLLAYTLIGFGLIVAVSALRVYG